MDPIRDSISTIQSTISSHEYVQIMKLNRGCAATTSRGLGALLDVSLKRSIHICQLQIQ